MENDVLYNRIMNVVHEEYGPPGGEGTKEITITENGTTTEDVRRYASAEITTAVPNSYTESDEGKVVDNGALVSQSSATYTENDTYDTTLINSVTVNVSGSNIDILNSTTPSGAITSTKNGWVESHAVYGRTGITSISAPNIQYFSSSSFAGCTGLQSIDFPSTVGFGGNTSGSTSHSAIFKGCTALVNVHTPEAAWCQSQTFYGCTSLVNIVLPKCTLIRGQSFQNCSSLENCDFGGSTLTIETQVFASCSKLTTLVIRALSVATLNNINSFNSTPFASDGTGGILYVPSALISSYQSADSWSTILGYENNQIKSIESTHTDPDAPIDLTLYYADGTLIPTP